MRNIIKLIAKRTQNKTATERERNRQQQNSKKHMKHGQQRTWTKHNSHCTPNEINYLYVLYTVCVSARCTLLTIMMRRRWWWWWCRMPNAECRMLFKAGSYMTARCHPSRILNNPSKKQKKNNWSKTVQWIEKKKKKK